MPIIEDKNKKEFHLSSATIKHIKYFHKINDPERFIKKVLEAPVAIIESKWQEKTHLYYGKKGKQLYRVVVTDMAHHKIKTAYTERKVKEGKLIWVSPKLIT